MGLTSGVYSLNIQGRHANLRHPHVVVVELARECWVVPAFGAEGAEVGLDIAAFEKAGYPADCIFVEIDNARHVRWIDGRESKPAKWLIARARKLPKAHIAGRSPVGYMDNEGLTQIITRWLALADRTDRVSPHLVKRLRKLLEELGTPSD